MDISRAHNEEKRLGKTDTHKNDWIQKRQRKTTHKILSYYREMDGGINCGAEIKKKK